MNVMKISVSEIKKKQMIVGLSAFILVVIILFFVSLSTEVTVFKDKDQKKKDAKRSTSVSSQVEKATSQYKTGNFEDAKKGFKGVISQKPKDPDAHYMLGNVYQAAGEPNKAIGEYKKATELDPRMVAAFYQLGLVYKAKEENEPAYKALEECVRQAPDLGGARIALAKMYTKDNRVDEAIGQYTSLVELKLKGMNLAEIYNELGQLYVKKGDVERAKIEWQNSLIIDPENQQAKDLLAEHP